MSGLPDFFILIASILVGFWPFMFVAALQGILNRKRRQKFLQWMGYMFRNIVVFWIILAAMWLGLLFFGREPFFLISEPLNSQLFWGVGTVIISIWLIIIYFASLKRRRDFEKVREINALQALSPGEFEELVTETFRRQGHRAKIAGKTGDHGVDVRVSAGNGEKWVVQCKRYKGSVGEPVVRDLYGTLLHEKAHRASIVTSGRFSRQAMAWAEGKPIDLYDREMFLEILHKLQKKKKDRPS